jgi:hypothetical protein
MSQIYRRFLMLSFEFYLKDVSLVHCLTLFCVISLLTACAAETDVTLYRGENYEMTTHLLIPLEAIAAGGGPAELEKSLNQTVEEAKVDLGAEASWRRDRDEGGRATFIIEVIGDSYKNMKQSNNMAFRVTEVDYNGRQALRFEKTFGLTQLEQFDYTLHGAEILDTNGTQTSSDTVTWHNPTGTIYAVLIPQSSTAWLFPLLATIIVGGLLAASLAYSIKVGYLKSPHTATSRNSTLPPAAASPTVPPSATSARFCPHCGASTRAGARFCMSCGKQMTLG